MKEQPLLLIEDDELLGSSMFSLLREQQYPVDWQKTGINGNKAIQDNHYALIMLDAELPGTLGIDLLKSIRRHNNRVPVIMVSGHACMEDKQAFLNAGADRCLAKPFDVDELMSEISTLLANTGDNNGL